MELKDFVKKVIADAKGVLMFPVIYPNTRNIRTRSNPYTKGSKGYFGPMCLLLWT